MLNRTLMFSQTQTSISAASSWPITRASGCGSCAYNIFFSVTRTSGLGLNFHSTAHIFWKLVLDAFECALVRLYLVTPFFVSPASLVVPTCASLPAVKQDSRPRNESSLNKLRRQCLIFGVISIFLDNWHFHVLIVCHPALEVGIPLHVYLYLTFLTITGRKRSL